MEFSPKPAVPVEQLLPNSSEETRSLFRGLTHLDPNKRLTAAQALEHPYFTARSAPKPTAPDQLPRVSKKKPAAGNVHLE
jgi:serine/threonine protein kinase